MGWEVILATIITAAAGIFWAKIEKVLKALKELGDVFSAISRALEDKKLTPEEMAEIKKEIGEAIASFKGILK